MAWWTKYTEVEVELAIANALAGGGPGTPAAPIGSIQFNDAGAFGGDANLTWDGSQLQVGTAGDSATPDVYIGTASAAFSESISNFLSADQMVVAYHGTGANRFSSLQSVFETTDANGATAVQGLAATTGAGDVTGVVGYGFNTGASDIYASGVSGFVSAKDTGKLVRGAAFHALNTFGNVGEIQLLVGLYIDSLTAGSLNQAINYADKFIVDASGFIAGVEQAEPAAPAANGYRIFAKDNGGKTQLMVRFNTGASQPLAQEP